MCQKWDGWWCNVNELYSQRETTLTQEWIHRDGNQRADHVSQSFDCDDWEVTDSVFQSLDKQWGPHCEDRFSADYKAAKIQLQVVGIGTGGVNAFDQP